MRKERAASRHFLINREDTELSEDQFQLEAIVRNLPFGFETLRSEALAEGHGFIEKLATAWMACAMRFDRE